MRKEMNEDMMVQVNGGWHCTDPYEDACADNYIHPYCGGDIENVYNPFASCKCKKCGETNYFFKDFYPSATLAGEMDYE